MKIIEVPVYNDDGSIKVTHLIPPEEAQALLQFALNFLTATGLQQQIYIATKGEDEEIEFDD